MREPRRTVLIVCEGAKTEPQYFSYFKKQLRLSNVHLDICGSECGSDPLSVVSFARARFEKNPAIDDCFCVIDRDEHDPLRFAAAKEVSTLVHGRCRAGRTFSVVISDPCIEYWFYLHFNYSRAPIVRQGNRSPGDQALELLRSVWPEYEKSRLDLGEALQDKFAVGKDNAARGLRDAIATGEANPSSNVYLVIDHLHEIASED